MDITTPPIWDGDTVSMVDLDLDVVQTLDGQVLVVDEDEFGKNQVSYWYPQDMITSARTSCDEIAAAMHRRDEPIARSAGAGCLTPELIIGNLGFSRRRMRRLPMINFGGAGG